MLGKSHMIGDFTEVSRPSQILSMYQVIARRLTLIPTLLE